MEKNAENIYFGKTTATKSLFGLGLQPGGKALA